MGIKGLHALYEIRDEMHRMTEEQTHHDDDIVPALSRKTQDGPGFDSEDELPESDFEAFATDDVENTEEDPK